MIRVGADREMLVAVESLIDGAHAKCPDLVRIDAFEAIKHVAKYAKEL